MIIYIVKTKNVIVAKGYYSLDLISILCYYYGENVIKFQHILRFVLKIQYIRMLIVFEGLNNKLSVVSLMCEKWKIIVHISFKLFSY